MVRPNGWGRRAASRTTKRSVLAGALAAVAGLAGPAGLDAQRWKTLTSARQVTGEEDLQVRVDYGAGVLTLQRGDAGELYSALFHFDEDWALPKAEYARGRLEVGLAASDGRDSDLGAWPDEASLDLEFAGGVPLDIELNFGAGQAELDLTGLAVRKLVVNTGASESVIRVDEANPERMEWARINVGAASLRVDGVGNMNADRVAVKSGLGSVTLRLDGEWAHGGHVVVSMGLGALKLQAPRWLGVRLRRPGSFLASIETDGLEKRGKVYQSANWERAERRVEIEITAVLGSVDLDWIS